MWEEEKKRAEPGVSKETSEPTMQAAVGSPPLSARVSTQLEADCSLTWEATSLGLGWGTLNVCFSN